MSEAVTVICLLSFYGKVACFVQFVLVLDKWVVACFIVFISILILEVGELHRIEVVVGVIVAELAARFDRIVWLFIWIVLHFHQRVILRTLIVQLVTLQACPQWMYSAASNIRPGYFFCSLQSFQRVFFRIILICIGIFLGWQLSLTTCLHYWFQLLTVLRI